jgi:hypothetical protein
MACTMLESVGGTPRDAVTPSWPSPPTQTTAHPEAGRYRGAQSTSQAETS